MAYINKEIPTMAMPKSFDRMGQFPLDASSVFYNKKELENYAASNPIAYVGQIISLVDEENNKVTIYSIQNVAGDLQEIGSIPEIPEYIDTDTKTTIESADSYITINGDLVENQSNTFTIGVNEAALKTLIGATTTAAMEFKGVTDELKLLADKGDLYKVTSLIVVDEKDDAEGKGFIANVGDSIVSDGAGKWYLIPSGDDIEDTNDTYSAGNGIEISEGNENSDHTVSVKLAVDEKNLKVDENGLATNFDLADYATNAEAKADDGIRYINQTEINKLEKLFFQDDDLVISGSVNADSVIGLNEWITNNRNAIAGLYPESAVTNLSNALTSLENLTTQVTVNTTNINSLNTQINALTENLNNYVQLTVYNDKMAAIDTDIALLKNAVTWKPIEEN